MVDAQWRGRALRGGLGGTGMGKSTARRLRPLLGQAHTTFADVAGIGRARGGSASAGGHDERERTLNQILTEMDGFTGSESVVVLGRARR